MGGCSQLRTVPNFSRNIERLYLDDSKIEELPASIVRHWSRLEIFNISSRSLKRLTYVPQSVTTLDLSQSDIKQIPDCVIGLPHLVRLYVNRCTKLVSIQGLPPSLEMLYANDCVSLKRVCFSFHNAIKELMFYNCLNLDDESRRRIIQQSYTKKVCLPGKEIPEEFTHKTKGNSITIPLDFSPCLRFKVCLLLLPLMDQGSVCISCHLISKGVFEINTIQKDVWCEILSLEEHLFMFCDDLFHEQKKSLEVDMTTNEILFEFKCMYDGNEVIECGVQILREEVEGGDNEGA